MDRAQVLQFMSQLLANDQVRTILVFIVADVIAGVAASLATRTFRLWKLADFMQTKVVPMILGYLALQLIVMALPEWEAIRNGAWALMLLSLSADFYSNLRIMFPQLPAPPILTKPADPGVKPAP